MKTGKPAAMARVLQHFSLLLLLPWSLNGFLTPVLAQENCNAAEVVLGGGEQHTFLSKEVEMTLFVKKESSFEGISVNVHGIDGTELIAWFPAEEECFPDKDTWYQLLTFVELKKENSIIEFGFETGPCERTCERDKAPQSLQNHSVVVHGTSRWRTSFPPNPCHFVTLATSPTSHKLPTCNKPELPAPTSTGTIIGITIGVLLAVTALVRGAV